MTVNELFEHFEKQHILIIGDVMLDSYLWGNVERISPEAPVPIVHIKKREIRLGGAANVALNIQSLGATPILCSVVGRDLDGQNLLSLIEGRQMSTEGILSVENRPTTVKQRVISGSQHMLRIDSETDSPLSSEQTQELLAKIKVLLPQCQAVIFEDYDKGVITPELIQKVVSLANQKGIPTIVDPKKRNFLAYENVTLFKPNLKELKEGLKIDFNKADQQEVKRAAALLMEKMNIKASLITLSEHGVFISNGQEEYFLPAHVRTISDVSGAGDTVVSVAALTLACGISLKRVAALSNLAGGIVCEDVGVMPIQKERLRKEVDLIW
jgi:rfaE bifunctional protein kinase chain/domain